jgi:cytochrome c553
MGWPEGLGGRRLGAALALAALAVVWLQPVRAAAADGAAIALHGVGTVPACATCHGAQGQGNPQIGAPHLAGEGIDYLREQLANFAAGHRINPIMQPIAAGLTPEQRDAAAAFFAALPVPAPHPVPAGADQAGARLAEHGRWSVGLPACTQCHGPNGIGVPPYFPRLAGLTAPYLTAQLLAWQQGHRPPGPLGLMPVVASKLSTGDIKNLAAYFAALGGPSTPEAGR